MIDSFIIHDLKNPISGIAGSVGLFMDGFLGPLSEDQKKYLKNMQLGVKLTLDMLSDLQAIIDLEEGKFVVEKASFPGNELQKNLSWAIEYAKKDGKIIQVNIPENISIFADINITSKIIENLLLNSVKQSGRGETITLNIKNENRGVSFEVFDLRKGISKEILYHIFENDFKSKYPDLRSHAGPAQNLYFCKLAIEACGGSISAELIDSGGCVFRFYFPERSDVK